MTVEAATYLSDLNTSYPASGDNILEGDDQIRLIKTVLKTNTFPNITGQVTSSHTELNLVDGLTGTILTTANFGTTLVGGWTLMKSTTVTAVAAVDFVSGTGGVTISTAYDEYLIVCDQVYCDSVAGDFRLNFSVDTGSTFAAGTYSTQAHACSSGSTVSNDQPSVAYVALDAITVNRAAATAVNATNAQILIARPVGATDKILGSCRFVYNAGAVGGICYFGGDCGATQFDGLRLNWSTGSFAANGTIKFYGRKV